MRTSLRSAVTSPWAWIGGVLLLLILLKFFAPLFLFDVPLGYDAGIYRYLFVKHAQAFPPFSIAPMDAWALEHPLGLFFFSTVLVHLGVPVDWFIGWIWNLMPVIVACAFAGVTGRRRGADVGVLTLFFALLSVAFYDGFLAMYWKTFASLLFTILSFHFLERRSWWAALAAVFAVAIHHQTGLLLGLVLGTWAIIAFVDALRGKRALRQMWASRSLFAILCGIAVFVIGLLWYVPIWREAVGVNLPLLLQRAGNVPPGSFPPLPFFLGVSGILLVFGLAGFVYTIRREGITVWHLPVLWPAFFIALQLLFHQRFYLYLEFFLLPFAAVGVLRTWKRAATLLRVVIVTGLALQASIAVWLAIPGSDPCRMPIVCQVSAVPPIQPLARAVDIADLRAMSAALPPNATVLALDPQYAPFVRGWLTSQHVGGPGIFNGVIGEVAQWETFVLGTSADRRALLQNVQRPLYLYVSPVFVMQYESATSLGRDACIRETSWPTLFLWQC